MYKFLSTLVITATLAACAPPTTIRTARIVPARFPDPSRPRQLAVTPLDGDTNGNFTALLNKSLAGISIDGHPYFTTPSQESIGTAAATTLPPGTTVTDTAVAIGRAAGAAGVLSGTVKMEYEERQPLENRTICLRADPDGGCLRWGDSAVSCTQREARVIFSPRLIVTENGRVSYARTIRARNSSVACSDATSPVSGKEELVRQAQELVLKEFRKDVAPYFVPVEAPVMNSSEGIPAGEGRDFFIQGLLAAEENRPDRACALWEKSAKFTSTSPGLQYDLGICRELAGELEAALEEYQKAEIHLKGPNETVATALARVKNEIAARNKVSGDASR